MQRTKHPSSLPRSGCFRIVRGCTPETLVSFLSPRQNSVVTPSLVKNYSNPDIPLAWVVSTPNNFPHLSPPRTEPQLTNTTPREFSKYHPTKFFTCCKLIPPALTRQNWGAPPPQAVGSVLKGVLLQKMGLNKMDMEFSNMEYENMTIY